LRYITTTQSSTPTINSDNGDIFSITGLASNITSFTTNLSGTPLAGDMMMIQVTDNGTARTLSFGIKFASTTNIPLPTTTVASTLLRMVFQWNPAITVWEIIALN
jgi:hypothetical protein